MKSTRLIECGISFGTAVVSYLLVGPIIYAFVFPYINNALISYSALFIPSVFTLLALLLLKKKSLFLDFLGPKGKRFSPSLFLLFFSSSFLILSLTSIIEGASINPAPLSLKLTSLIISLIFIPIQIGVEEYIFRILPYKAIDEERMERKSTWVLLSFLSGLLFTIPHLLNKEVWVEGGGWAVLHYFLWGAMVMAGAVYTKGFEFPLAMHLSNNLVVAIVANYRSSSLPSISFFILENETSSPKAIITFILLFALELFLFYALNRRKHIENKD